MALHLAHEGSLGAGELECGGIVAGANEHGLGEELFDFLVQGIDRLEVDRLVGIVMQMGE